MQEKPHIIYIGFHPSAIDSIDFDHYKVSTIIHKFLAQSLEPDIKEKFSGIGVLDIPHNMNLEEYINAMPQIEKLTEQLISKHGLPKAFISLYEHVTLPAAILREKYNIPGTSVSTATLCRDKVKMKQCFQGSAIRCPLFMAVDSKTTEADLKEIVKQLPAQIVLKPRAQAASEGVFVFNNSTELFIHFRKYGIKDNYQIEEFIQGKLCHFDGIVRDSSLVFFSASEYTTTCYNYVYRHIPMASVTIDDPIIFNYARDFTQTVLNQVGLENGTFHLEAFQLSNNELIFLEIANRFGGAGVVPLMNKAYGVDMIKETILADMLEPSEITEPFSVLDRDYSTAWLYIPVPITHPCQVKLVSGLNKLPESIIDSITVEEGQSLNQSAAPFPAIGRFFIKASSSEKVKKDCKLIIKNYHVEVE